MSFFYILVFRLERAVRGELKCHRISTIFNTTKCYIIPPTFYEKLRKTYSKSKPNVKHETVISAQHTIHNICRPSFNLTQLICARPAMQFRSNIWFGAMFGAIFHIKQLTHYLFNFKFLSTKVRLGLPLTKKLILPVFPVCHFDFRYVNFIIQCKESIVSTWCEKFSPVV